jgi:hypothetical protein
MKDFVYYLMVDGEIIPELIFSSEAAAIEFAEVSEMKDYQVVEWDVD